MKNSENLRKLLQSMNVFSIAYHDLLNTINQYERTTGMNVNNLHGFTEAYPFTTSFDELPIDRWVETVVDNVRKSAFKVLNYDYLNTGGNTMVGVFTVWIPALLQTVYALTNEEGCTLSVVDYISNEVDIDNYDELVIDSCDWGTLAGCETYFELYRHCLNEYTKSDCKYFGCTRGLPYHLLSDELQANVDADYLAWCEENNGSLVDTNGITIIISPDYEDLMEDGQLRLTKSFKTFHDTTAGNEDFYSEDYVLSFGGRTIHLPFNADTWSAIDEALKTTIENW